MPAGLVFMFKRDILLYQNSDTSNTQAAVYFCCTASNCEWQTTTKSIVAFGIQVYEDQCDSVNSW